MNIASMTTHPSANDAVSRDLNRLRETTGKVVGSVFFGTMLKAMRDDPIQGAYGHGGRGEDVFGAQLHAIYAERLGTSTNGGLQEALYQRLENQQRAMSQNAFSRASESDREPQAIIKKQGITHGGGKDNV